MLVDRTVKIPPVQPRYFRTQTYELEHVDPAARIHLIHVHAHQLGREMYTLIRRDGVVHELRRDEQWDFSNHHREPPLVGPSFSYRKGDLLQHVCVYDSSHKKTWTHFGMSTFSAEPCQINHRSAASPRTAPRRRRDHAAASTRQSHRSLGEMCNVYIHYGAKWGFGLRPLHHWGGALGAGVDAVGAIGAAPPADRDP